MEQREDRERVTQKALTEIHRAGSEPRPATAERAAELIAAAWARSPSDGAEIARQYARAIVREALAHVDSILEEESKPEDMDVAATIGWGEEAEEATRASETAVEAAMESLIHLAHARVVGHIRRLLADQLTEGLILDEEAWRS